MKRDSIGVFDSGLGGLSVLAEIRRLLPKENILYFADQAHIPYGPRPLQEVQGYAEQITLFLLDQGAKVIVLACNTASAAALHMLRNKFPSVPFVGMEPAVKPAAKITESKKVGVLATPATFQGELFASVVERFAEGVDVLEQTLPGLVNLIEEGILNGPQIEAILTPALERLLAEGVDTLVLACTHYPFIIPTIKKLVGPQIQVIDPAPAIARQTQRLLSLHKLENTTGSKGKTVYCSTKQAAKLADLANRLISERGQPLQVYWRNNTLIL
jgi:glutamate racemase